MRLCPDAMPTLRHTMPSENFERGTRRYAGGPYRETVGIASPRCAGTLCREHALPCGTVAGRAALDEPPRPGLPSGGGRL